MCMGAGASERGKLNIVECCKRVAAECSKTAADGQKKENETQNTTLQCELKFDESEKNDCI